MFVFRSGYKGCSCVSTMITFKLCDEFRFSFFQNYCNGLEDGLKKIKRKKKLVKIGGNMTVKSKKFINELFSAKLIDRAETRNIEFKINKNTLKNFDMIIHLILKFEIEWLKYKNTNFVTNNYAKKANSKRIADVFKR